MPRQVRIQRFFLKARPACEASGTIIRLRMLHIHAQWYPALKNGSENAARGFYDFGRKTIGVSARPLEPYDFRLIQPQMVTATFRQSSMGVAHMAVHRRSYAAVVEMGCRGMGTEIGAVLCLGGRERPRLYNGDGFNKVNFLLAKCDLG
jgi:hypothetical protein